VTSPSTKLHVDGGVTTSRIGTFGTYLSGGSEVQGIWSIGKNYDIDVSNDDFGNQYGIGYAYNQNGGAPFASEHQIVFTNNGNINAAIGLYGSGYFAGDIGFRTKTPLADLHLKQSNTSTTGTGGMRFESTSTNYWKIYHSGSHFSFANNGVREAYITGGTGVYVVTSDRDKKQNISELKTVLPSLMNLKPSRYQYKSAGSNSRYTYGLMVQDVKKTFPDLVHIDENGNSGLGYDEFVSISIKAIQEQQQLIETQQAQIDELKKEMEELKSNK
jgi:hypothetical protein